jgi:hypothetical protein
MAIRAQHDTLSQARLVCIGRNAPWLQSQQHRIAQRPRMAPLFCEAWAMSAAHRHPATPSSLHVCRAGDGWNIGSNNTLAALLPCHRQSATTAGQRRVKRDGRPSVISTPSRQTAARKQSRSPLFAHLKAHVHFETQDLDSWHASGMDTNSGASWQDSSQTAVSDNTICMHTVDVAIPCRRCYWTVSTSQPLPVHNCGAHRSYALS